MTRPPVYLDHAATTPVRPEALEAMLPYLTNQAFGNPSSAHRFGRAARAGIEQFARENGSLEVDEKILDAAREFFGM